MASAGVSAENIKAASSASILTTTTTGLAASQTTASVTATTLKNSIRGIKTEIKNLTTDVKNFAFLHPELLALVGTILAIGTAIKIVNAVQDWADGTSDIKKYNKSLEDSEQKISDNKSQMEEYQNELSQNKDKLEELQEAQKNGNITEAQKTEIDNLKYQNALLEEKLQKLKDINEQETKNQAHDAADRFNTEFNEGNDKNQSTNANDVIERVKKTYSNTSPDGESTGINWNAALNGNENDVGVQQLAKIKLATDEYNQAVHDLVNGVNDVTEEDVENYKYTLDTLTENFEGNKEKLYNDLTDGIKKMEAVKGTDDFDQQTYDNMQSWLEIFLNYIGEYKKAQETVGLTLTQTINRFKSSEESSLDELKQSYQDAIDKRNELYSGENYVGNVDINNRPVVINDDGSYSTTSTAFQEKWVGDEENGHYIIAHFTPILPDGTVLDEETLNDYIDRILNSDNPMEADKPENGGYGIVYKIDTEINGQEINDGNLEDAFGIADAWDVDMHNLQDKMYASEAQIKSQIENFEGGIDGSQTIKDFFDTEGINTQSLINEFNEVTDGITDADEAIQKWNEHKKQASSNPDLTSLLTESDDKSKDKATLADLQSEADLLSTIQKELDDNGRIGVSSMQSIIKKYPEAKAALSDYMQGIISEQELFSQLETIYENDKNQYIQSVVDKSQTDEEFFNAVMTNYPELYNQLSSLYENDVNNWSNMEQAKYGITQNAIDELSKIWSDYFKAVRDANGKLTVQTTGWYDAGMYSADPDEVEAMDEEYNNMYNHSYLMNLQIEYRSQNKSIYSKMIGVDAANTIEQNFMMIGNLDFDTLELRLYGINYSENKLLLLVYGNYSTNESSGEDEWTNDYSDDFLIEVPIIKDGFLNYEDAHVIKTINHKCYTIDEPSSYEDFNLTYYYNPYTKDFYSVYYHEDFEGDISYSSSDTEWSGYTAKYMYHYIISHAQFSLIDVDATISIHDFSTRDNNFTIYVFNKKKIVKNVLTDEDFFGTLNNSSSQITIEYNGRDIYIINITKNLIRKLNFDTKTFKITL